MVILTQQIDFEIFVQTERGRLISRSAMQFIGKDPQEIAIA